MLNPSAASAAAANMVGRDDAGSELAESSAQAPALTASELARAEHLRGIVRQHFASVWRFLRRVGFEPHIVDDAAQDLFFVALRRIDEVTPGRERAFLFGAALRIATKMKRKGAREIPVERIGMRAEPEENVATPEQLLDGERARALLYQLLSELDERLRVVLVMFEVEGMTMQEIAEVLEIPMGTVASRLRLGRDDLRVRLERYRARTRREVGR